MNFKSEKLQLKNYKPLGEVVFDHLREAKTYGDCFG